VTALLATATEALRAPLAVGLKLADRFRLSPSPTTVGRLSAPSWKSPALAPPRVTASTCSGPGPRFFNCADCAVLLAPTGTVPKSRLAGLKAARARGGTTARPW